MLYVHVSSTIRTGSVALEFEASSSTKLPHHLQKNAHPTPQEEIDQKSVIRLTWRKLLEVCERVTDMLQSVQGKYKRQLIRNVKVRKRISIYIFFTPT